MEKGSQDGRKTFEWVGRRPTDRWVGRRPTDRLAEQRTDRVVRMTESVTCGQNGRPTDVQDRRQAG